MSRAPTAARGGKAEAALLPGQIIAAYGRRYLVETRDGLISCVPRGKRSEYACGDRVAAAPTSEGEGVIEAADPRSTLFFRAAPHRTKLIAANATQVAMVTAAEPSFSDELVCRVLAAAENAGMKVLLVLNKCDLVAQAEQARERLRPFVQAGHELLEISALQDVGVLRERLLGEASVLVGQSGMGKSTLVNALFPGAGAATREISAFLSSGKHTTTHALLYRLDAEGSGPGSVIDCPGMKEFGLAHLDWRELSFGFREFRPLLGQCRFPDCRHQREPGCAVAAAAEQGLVAPRRLELYRRIQAGEAAARRA